MRIIAGKNKGKKLKTFSGTDVRPTSDRARESLFNILSNKVLGCNFLDLCCGTGAMGLEAHSRGASKVVFVDSSRESAKLSTENAKSIGLFEQVVVKDAISYLKTTSDKFDIIFFDPPYAFSGIETVLNLVKEYSLLKENGVFIYEHDKSLKTVEVNGFSVVDSRKYGVAVFDFYKE
ncbi:MAG: 16S rRNA (guanine(966)-N(2))-methyltransferase RsmD [Clostridia bacterium]|nr:16S rRNA (guanine(966)-N(2))-methyltransferase RsmD [Clostridia bacterium]